MLAALAAAGFFLWRPLAARWCDDRGNLAMLRGDLPGAAIWFAQGLALEPGWHMLLEDHGRAVLDADPLTALSEFRRADCGQPCLAEAGDAESRLGRAQAAVNDYLAAHAVDRVANTVDNLSRKGRYDRAIALERALVVRLGTGMLAQADLANAYFRIGNLDAAAEGARIRGAGEFRRDALVSYRRASELAPFNEGYLLSLGFAELRFGDRKAAREAFERELDLHPHESDAERGLAQLDAAPHH